MIRTHGPETASQLKQQLEANSISRMAHVDNPLVAPRRNRQLNGMT
jgi:hypothetical protein